MEAERILRIGEEELIGLSTKIFEACGMNEEDAAALSRSLVYADMRGVKSHGLVRIPSYVEQLEEGTFSPVTKLDVIKETAFSTVLEGNNGLGAVVSYKAVELTKKKARENGIAFTAVRGSNHYGAAGLWSYLLSQDKDLIGFTATNAIPIVAAVGGSGRGIGSNPFSFAIPAGKYANMCLDISVGHMAQGKIWEYKRLGRPLPEGAWMGPDGAVTTDPDKFDINEYIMMPFGGHKGFGLGVIMEMFTSALAGGEFHRMFGGLTKDMPKTSHCFMAMRLDAFTDAADYRKDVDDYIDYLHALPVKEGFQAPKYPGEIEAACESDSVRNGVPVPYKVLEDMKRTAEGKCLDVSGYGKYLD
ncbi:Ldh family oxidoreductase [Qiania dongpingensis]|uniref:Ldh family oxidoreductase n=1 Tax=Qiania dongpingensis TaxID=2763669 RepID=A0A7G9G6T2_9FIRM|nr:Ldh family oxidoreductase [Qiania dongpingensis]QNM06514.1 Ldh family oxidoreductase [Qiania dongpingensis]